MVRNNDSGGDQNYSAEDVRTHACKILANLAAIDEHNAVRVVQEGGLRAILSVFGGFPGGYESLGPPSVTLL